MAITLVSRHINLVHSVALRYTANDEDAKDVTQAVFIILAKKAVRLRERTVLTGWFYETTRLAAAGFLRARARRQTHEQEAFMQSTLNESASAPVWHQLAPHLEDAMSRLGEGDRALLALRYFENKTGAETAALLGIGEAAAHKRTARALEKLRSFFGKRGIAVSAVAIASAVSANSVQAAPAALAKTVSVVAITKGAAISVNLSMLVKGTMKAMAWMKFKFAIGASMAILLAGGATALVSSPHISDRSYMLKGQISWSEDENVWSEAIEVQRKGDTFKITKIDEGEWASNHDASVFVCTKSNAMDFSQNKKGANAGSPNAFSTVTLSNYRRPFGYGMSLVWLMIQAGAESERGSNLVFRPIFGDFPRTLLHEYPVVTPKTSKESFWAAGFSDYSEIYTNQEGVVRQTTFTIQDWTNVAGIKFPKSFVTNIKFTPTDTNSTPIFPLPKYIHCKFVTTQIEALPSEIDTRIPKRSRVLDWRPREDGTAETGVEYYTTNGVIYPDVLKAVKEQGIHTTPVNDYAEDAIRRAHALAPDFEVKTLSGESAKLSSFRGKYVLLAFWSSVSEPCIRQIPALKATYEAFGKNGRLTILGLALDDERKKWKQWSRNIK